jgi:hypothetical protein
VGKGRLLDLARTGGVEPPTRLLKEFFSAKRKDRRRGQAAEGATRGGARRLQKGSRKAEHKTEVILAISFKLAA